MIKLLTKNWFLLGLVGVAFVTLADKSNITVTPGLWLKLHNGPDCVIVLIFFLSGMALDTSRIRAGVSDYSGTLSALFLIFIIAPLLAVPFLFLPIEPGILLGISLVAVMPTTLSSGVVMTGRAGGNMAHALLITIFANSLAVITIPLSLGFLLTMSGDNRSIEIDQLPIMIKIATLVLTPLIGGIIIRNNGLFSVNRILPYTGICSQIGILAMVWMALCQGREAIVANLGAIFPIIGIISIFHITLVLAGIALSSFISLGKGRRESVILMGGQKTLPLSVILQVSLFPEYGVALVVCVLHHIVHLIMDAFLSQYLKAKA